MAGRGRAGGAWNEEPTLGDQFGDWAVFASGVDRHDFAIADDTANWHPVPVGRVAATVTVTHCLPIGPRRRCEFSSAEHVCFPNGYRGERIDVWLKSDGAQWTCDDITEQTVWQPGAWLPGRWALQVTDPTPRSDQ